MSYIKKTFQTICKRSNMKNIKHLLLTTIYIMSSFSQASCQKQQPSKLSYSNPYDLTRIDFNMNVPEFMSGSILFKEFIMRENDENYKDDYSMINRDTEMTHFCYWANEIIFKNVINREKGQLEDVYERRGIRYNQQLYISEPLATFHSIEFQQFHAITNLQDQLQAIAVVGKDLNMEDIEKTILFCDKNYERIPIDRKKTTYKGELFQWKTSDLVYLMVVENKLNNAFRFAIEKDEDGKLIDIEQLPRDEKIYTNVTFFIFKKEAERVLQDIQHGDFMKFPAR